jgi:branched-chain amino acid transport system permease protein
VVAVVLLAFASLPLFATHRLISVATSTLIFAIAAYGLYFLYSQSGQMSVAHGALMGLAGYTAALLDLHLHIGFWPAIPIALATCFAAGFLVGLPSIRVSGHYFLIVTFAFAQVFVITGENWISLTNGVDGLGVRDSPEPILGLPVDTATGFFYMSLVTTAVVVVIIYALSRTRFCRLLRAARQNERLAASLGMNVLRSRFLAFAISGLFPGLAGVFYAYYLSHVQPDTFGITAGVDLILMLVLGGSSSLLGPLTGALFYFYLPEVISLTPTVSRIVFGMLLVVTILVLPNGLAGSMVRGVRRLAARDRRRTGETAAPEGAKR